MGDIMEDALDITETAITDDSIKGVKMNEYYPTSGSSLNMPGKITINIDNEDQCVFPHHGMLKVEGDLTLANGTAFTTEEITLINNGVLFLFSNIKYILGGKEIENIYYPGIANTMLNYLKHPSAYAKAAGLSACWFPDTDTTCASGTNLGFATRKKLIITSPVPKGHFQFCIPLSDIFGFCEDFRKYIYGCRHSVELIRTSDNDAIFKATSVGGSKVEISKLTLLVPTINLNTERKYKLLKIIESKKPLQIMYRQRQCEIRAIPPSSTIDVWNLGMRDTPEKPRFLIIGLQNAKSDNQDKNTAIFDHMKMTKISVKLNNEEYPGLDIINDFDKNEYAQIFRNLSNFPRDFYGIDTLVGNTAVSGLTFKTLFPLFVFDISRQSERITRGMVDIQIKMMFKSNPGKDIIAYALLISDKIFNLESDGKSMSVQY